MTNPYFDSERVYTFLNRLNLRWLLFWLSAILIGVLYFSLTATSIINIKEGDRYLGDGYKGHAGHNTQHTFDITVHSKVTQNILINIVAKDEILAVTHEENFLLPHLKYQKGRTSHKNSQYGDIYQLSLNKGENLFQVKSRNSGNEYTIYVKQKRSLYEYIFAFAVFLLPLIIVASKIFLEFLDSISYNNIQFNPSAIPLLLLISAIIIRFFHYITIGEIQFQHDYYGHIEYIKFFAEQFAIPLPHKGWEFPQQPLYYIATGLIYKSGVLLELQERKILFYISGFSFVTTSIALVYGYRLVRRLTKNIFAQSFTIGFLGLTPSFVYMSTRINNDPLTFALVTIGLFYLVASYQNQFQKYFVRALFFTTLAFLTKLSAVSLELIFLIMLIAAYMKTPTIVRPKTFHYAWVGILILGYSIFKNHYPAVGETVMVNSGIWPGQDIRPMNAKYFFTFNFLELFSRGEAYWQEEETKLISRSFFTYQFGTMLFGEFSYDYWHNKNYHLIITMQIIILTALLFPIGLIANFWRKKTFLDYCLIVMATTNFALLIKFMVQYPSTANTDFRYYAAAFFALAYLSAMGLQAIAQLKPIIAKIIYTLSGLLFVFSALFCLTLAST